MTPSPMICARQLLHVRQSHARALGPATFLLDRAATELAERLSAVVRRFELAVDLGTPPAGVRRALAASGKIGAIVAAADAPDRDSSYWRVAADEEALPFADQSLDLVVASLPLH